ncbi:MAG TPA: J domain-containing protein [Thermoanaerobaculia bacterium]|nr:J domain-containing protein [Thermoanaerobaculia bacterium]
MHLTDCYRLLELEPPVSEEEIKRAYLDLTKVWHPDRFGSDAALRRRAEEKLKAINEAYETLRGTGTEWEEQAPPAPPEPSVDPARQRVYRNRSYALTCALIAIFILLRRPSPAFLVIAVALLIWAFVFVRRMRGGRG